MKGKPLVCSAKLFGIALVIAAIVVDTAAYKRLPGQTKGISTKGLVLSVLCGILMGFFYRFVAKSMSTDFINIDAGKLSPYTAVLFSRLVYS